MPKWASNFLRKLVSEYLGENKTLTEIIVKSMLCLVALSTSRGRYDRRIEKGRCKTG